MGAKQIQSTHAYRKDTHRPSRLYRNPVFLAQEWQKALSSGDCSRPADLGRKLGISRARVTQMLRLLNLAPEVLKAIAALGDPLPSPIVTERRLRPIVNLLAEEQRRRVEAILAKGKQPIYDLGFGVGASLYLPQSSRLHFK